MPKKEKSKEKKVNPRENLPTFNPSPARKIRRGKSSFLFRFKWAVRKKY